MTITKADMPKVVGAVKEQVFDLLVLMAAAELLREKCDAIQRRLLATGKYGGDGNPRNTWELPDEDAKRYFADLDHAYREAGYESLPPGYCPALIAEAEQTDAENRLIKAAEPFFQVTNHQLLCGTKTLGGLETRKRYLDLLIKLVVNYRG